MIKIQAYLNDSTSVEFSEINLGNRTKITIQSSQYELWIANNEEGEKENLTDYNNYSFYIRQLQPQNINYLEFLFNIFLDISYYNKYLIKKNVSVLKNYTSLEYPLILKEFEMLSRFFYFKNLKIDDFALLTIGNKKNYKLINFSNAVQKPIDQSNNILNFTCNCGNGFIFQTLDYLLDKNNGICPSCGKVDLEKNYEYTNYKKQRGL